MPIIQKYPFYNFDKVNFSKFDLSKNYLEGFILKINSEQPIEKVVDDIVIALEDR